MKLLVNELITELNQRVSSDANTIIEGVRVHLYKHNIPAGSLYLELRDENNQVFATSEVLEIAAISEANFFHGQVRFYINAYLQESKEYYLVLCNTDYSFSESAYVGWCLDYEFNTYSSYATTSHTQAPHDYEFWQRK